MDGKLFAKLIEKALAEKGIKKGDFYEAVGISATAMYGWKNGATPKKETIEAIEDYLDLELLPYERQDKPADETEELLEMLRDRQDLRILLKSGKDVPPSSIYQLIAQLEKEKENA